MQNLVNLNYLSEAYEISNTGQVVGYFIDHTGKKLPFIWENSVLTEINDGYLSLKAINDIGQAAGYRSLSGGERACLWENGSTTILERMYDASGMSYAYGINNMGQIVGNSYVDHTHSNRNAFLWGNGQTRDLGTLSGWSSFAEDINENGQVVGYYLRYDNAKRACLWDNGTSISIGGLGSLEGESRAYGINNSGQVVGQAAVTVGAPDYAFLWENGQMLNLNLLVPEGSDFVLQKATAINNYGWIVGTGKRPGEDYHAFLLTPIPEPSLAILLVGVLGLLKRA